MCDRLRSVVAEHVFVQEWNELENEFEIEKCGDQKKKSRLNDGGRQVDLARNSAGAKTPEGEKNREKRWQRPRKEAAAVVRRGTGQASATMATRKQVHEALQRKKEGAQSRGACLDLENDVAEETMSVMVKLAKDPLEPDGIDQQTSESRK